MDNKQLEDLSKDPRVEFFVKEYSRIKKEIEELMSMSEDDSMSDLVKDEVIKLKEQQALIEKQIESIISKDNDNEEELPNEIILEIRAGAGGNEASLFSRDLANMYEKYADSQNWNFSIIDISENESDGYKEAVFSIKGKDVYKKLLYEQGVHRIQRVPVTEKSGRVHTSTSAVAVLPVRKKIEIKIDPSDLKVETSRSGGAGGQNVNKIESAVRIIHLPTGIDVRCTKERSQLKNREIAMSILASKLENTQREKNRKEYEDLRSSQIGNMDRSEKIRTYNVLQDRITDHRIKKSWSNIDNILNGNMGTLLKDVEEFYNDK